MPAPAWARRLVIWLRRSRRGTLEFEHELAEVAPIPVLARFVRPDNRVSGQAEVRGGGPARRVVTASGVTAFLADRRDGVLDQQRGPSSGPGQRRGLVTGEQRARVLGCEEMAGRRGAYGALVMGAAPSGSGTARPAVVAVTARGGDLIRVIRGLG